ncbi:MFS peptide transporter [Lipomyces kononenkoae]|uniref:MFS peptide transporter n=1 Tax=Lipomyces kononenkoae TaxID=34357 RepID=A0ACC3SQI4_LIPKO
MATHLAEGTLGDVSATPNSFAVPRDTKHDPEKAITTTTTSVTDDDDDKCPAPTEEERKALRKVPASLPVIAWAICLVELAERASYYGASSVFSNFIEFPLPQGGNGAGAPPQGTQETAGALGMGLQAATGLTLLFTFLAYVVPIFGGWWADVRVGRFYAIIVGVIICGIAHIIQIIGAIPSVLRQGPSHAAAPFILGLLILAFGAGIFKPNVAPTLLDQHRHQKEYTKVLKSGEKVIVSPDATNTRTMLIFYGFINIGAFFTLATTYSEKYVGYWLSFLVVGILYFILPVVLAFLYKRLYRQPASGQSDLTKAFKIIGTALRTNHFRVWRKDFWDAAKPSRLSAQGVSVDWNDKLVDDVRRTFQASFVFLYFPIWALNDGGIGSVGSNQGAAMITNGAPNDLLNNFNPLTIIVFIPILSYIVYPTLDKFKIKFGRISRITLGFTIAAISGIWGAVIQYYVYKLSPCGYYASTCDEVAPISIWWQIPNTVLGAMSECFCNVTAYELAYARSPASMRGLVMALFLFNNALASALGEILIPAITDPYLIWVWAGPAIALFVQTVIFWFQFKHMNDESYMIYEEDYPDEKQRSELAHSDSEGTNEIKA